MSDELAKIRAALAEASAARDNWNTVVERDQPYSTEEYDAGKRLDIAEEVIAEHSEGWLTRCVGEIDRLSAGWVRVEDGLPEDSARYVATLSITAELSFPVVRISRCYQIGGCWWWWQYDGVEPDTTVVAWCPLPEVPEWVKAMAGKKA